MIPLVANIFPEALGPPMMKISSLIFNNSTVKGIYSLKVRRTFKSIASLKYRGPNQCEMKQAEVEMCCIANRTKHKAGIFKADYWK
jgi:hypothetical protein